MMTGWQDLLQTADERITAPWLGGRNVHTRTRMLRIKGRAPRAHGWYSWKLNARDVEDPKEVAPNHDLLVEKTCMTGYLVGDHFAPDTLHGRIDPAEITKTLERVYLIDDTIDRFSRVVVGRIWTAGQVIFKNLDAPLGPEPDVLQAFYDRAPSITHIKGVTPALESAFRLESYQRTEAERIRAELERKLREEEERRAAEERRAVIATQLGTGAGRREMARIDFLTAARAALAVGGAELLDWRQGPTRREFVVTYRVDDERLQCVVDETMHVIDAGVCLTDHGTGRKGDTLFTLESLPAVIREAIREDKLVKWRHPT
jgi:hypothetical protein